MSQHLTVITATIKVILYSATNCQPWMSSCYFPTVVVYASQIDTYNITCAQNSLFSCGSGVISCRETTIFVPYKCVGSADWLIEEKSTCCTYSD